jgi:hypothetical protein
MNPQQNKTKPAFLMLNSYRDILAPLSDRDLGKLVRVMFDYEADEKIPTLSKTLSLAFSFIKKDLDYGKERYERICERNKANIAKRWDTSGIPKHTKNTSGKSGIPVDTKNTNINKNINTNINKRERKYTHPNNANLDDFFLQDVANKNQVPLSFVRSKYEDMVLWHEQDPAKNKKIDWKATLRAWVKKDSLKIKQDYAKQKRGAKIVSITTDSS